MSKFDLLHKEIVDIKKQLVDCNLSGSSNNPNEEDSKDFATSNDASEDEKDVWLLVENLNPLLDA